MDTIEKSGEKTKHQKKLNYRQELFVSNYIKCGNARLACEQSGYTNKDLSGTAYQLLRNPRIIKEIEAKKASLHKELVLKDRSTFLSEVESLKATCLEKGRVGELIKLLTLEASVLGIDKRDVSVQTTNIFNTMDTAKAFLNGFKDTNAEEAVVGAEEQNKSILDPLERKQSIDETANPTTQMDATHIDGTNSTLSGEVIDIPFETGGGGKG